MDDQRTDRENGSMEAIAMALLSAATYIELRNSEFTEDDDTHALEEIAFALKGATPAEIEALISAANAFGWPYWPKDMGIVEE